MKRLCALSQLLPQETCHFQLLEMDFTVALLIWCHTQARDISNRDRTNEQGKALPMEIIFLRAQKTWEMASNCRRMESLSDK